ncbi:gliding motility-associated protein GldE [Chondrinema litorale]|uniref:gliding motility-associated protein GldE n=1 Tax=Chondrinema litorale TaxID=2994555 RepID=UPI0025437B98|nr:gliding motility-associated protein GldE [Chondrinema litorale]UZR95839.1 gliding motility-associated protein GldE [Chondrinema litorale]
MEEGSSILSEADPYIHTLGAILSLPVIVYPIFFASLILLLLSALISGSEVAFFSLSPKQLESCKNSNKPNSVSIVRLLSNPKLLLATILILNNLVNVALVTLSTYATWEISGRDNENAVFILTILVTAAIVFFGEIVPKIYATEKNLSFARMTSRVLYIASTILKPFSWFLMIISDRLERRFQHSGYDVSMNELKQVVDMTTTGNEDKELLKGIVSFGTKTVKQIMCSRIDITAVDVEDDFHQLMDKVNKCSYSRIPIYNETIDKIEGILYVKELLPFIDRDENFEWQQLFKRNPFFVPESKKIDELLRDFQQKRVHMAIVVDEYGGTSGLITMEDIIEEIVGEINDEFDDDEGLEFKRLEKNLFTFEGKTSLNDFCKVVKVDPSIFDGAKGESESLGGLLLELFSRIPNSGETYDFKNFRFTVVSVDKKRIKSVRVLIRDKSVYPPQADVSP